MRESRRAIARLVRPAVLLIATSLSACGGSGGPDDILARVGTRGITKRQFEHWLSVEGGVTAGARGASLKKRIMQSLISAERTRARAFELGVHVSPTAVEQQLLLFEYESHAGLLGRGLVPREGELKKALASYRLTHTDRLALAELSLLAAKIEQKEHLIAERQLTHAQLARYYQRHRRRFEVPEEREFMILQTASKATVLRAKREIEAGRGFLSVAKRVSIDEEAPEGLQHLRRGEEEPEFVAHIFAAKLHELVGPVKQGVDYYIFELIRITPPRPRTLSEAEPTIRRLLAGEKPGAH
jgi:hypothetical protein